MPLEHMLCSNEYFDLANQVIPKYINYMYAYVNIEVSRMHAVVWIIKYLLYLLQPLICWLIPP